MWTWLKSLWLDQAVARTFLLAAVAFGGAYAVQPTGRTEFERLAVAAALAFGVGGAAVSAPKGKP